MKRNTEKERRYPEAINLDYHDNFAAGYKLAHRNPHKDPMATMWGELPGKGNLVAAAEACEKERDYCQEQLSDLQERHDLANESRINLGLSVQKEYSSDMQRERFRYEARLDNSVADLKYLNDRLKEGDAIVREATDDQVLQYGLRMNRVIVGDRLQSIDGQGVTYINGRPVISSKSSPYFGISVEDYVKIAEVYKADRIAGQQAKLSKIQEEAIREHKPVPGQLPVRSPKTVPLNSLPGVPEGTKRYL